MENTEETKFEGVKQFFKEDAKLKQTMMNLAPSQEEIQSTKAKIEYTDKVEKKLKSIILEFKIIAQKLGIQIDSQLDEFHKRAIIELTKSLKHPNGIEEFYKNSISNMDTNFVEEVKHEFVGYTCFMEKSLQDEIQKAKSINELLHVVHSFIVNNDELLKSMPVIENKKYYKPEWIERFNEKGKEVPESWANQVTLYGEENPVARNLFEGYPVDTKSQWVDILGFDNKILIMARDLGHALTVDIDTGREKPIVKYFIPKICNKKMVEELPGIGKITQNGANGVFEVENTQELNERIYDFMDRVPTDNDIVYEQNDNNKTNFTVSDVQELVSTRRISEVKTIVGKLKDKMKEKDTTEKSR